MPISSAQQPQPPAAGSQRPQPTATSGSYSKKSVHSKTTSHAERASPINAIPGHSIRAKSAHKATGSEQRGVFSKLKLNKLKLAFAGSSGSKVLSSPDHSAATGEVAASGNQYSSSQDNVNNTVTLTSGGGINLYGNSTVYQPHHRVTKINESRDRIIAAKINALEGLDSKKSSAEVAAFLRSGDKGISEGVSALQAMGVTFLHHLSPEDEKLYDKATYNDLQLQSNLMAHRARWMHEAEFGEDALPFSKICAREENTYDAAMAKDATQDAEMRAWIRDGLNLANDIVEAQEQIICEGKLVADERSDAIGARVDLFCSGRASRDAKLDIPAEMGSFSGEVIATLNKETQV